MRPSKTRVKATRDFVLTCLEGAALRKAEIVKLLAAASRPAESPQATDQVAIRSRAGRPGSR